MEFDLVIHNGTIVDGTGRPRFRADLGLRDGRIVAVAEGEPPRLEPSRVTEYAKLTRKVLAHGKPKQRKEVIQSWAGEIKMAPEEREVLITYRFPEPFMNSMVAGAGFEPAIFRL